MIGNTAYQYTAPLTNPINDAQDMARVLKELQFQVILKTNATLDMAGNVWEWASDWFDANYYRNSPARNPQGPASGDQAVLRGGGWSNIALYVRAPNRNRNAPALRDGYVGFRCAKTL